MYYNYNSTIRPRKSLNPNQNKKLFLVSDSLVDIKRKADDDDKKKMTCCENLNEYLLNTSLHGLKYIGDINLSIIERIFFTCSFIIVICMSAYFISNLYEKWSETPVIIGLNPTATPLKDIPFPAVTICNMNQAKRSVAKTIQKKTLEYSLLESLCVQDESFNKSDNFQGKWSKFREFLINVTQPCSELLFYCRYALETRNCAQVFKSMLTDEGVCCTFNGVSSDFMFRDSKNSENFHSQDMDNEYIGINWTPENGFPNNLTKNMFPRPVAGAGNHLGLTVVLDAQVDDYYCSSTSGAGFKILLHNPIETPKIANYGFFVQPGKETQITVTPRISDASNLIRKVAKNLRQCIFANEGNLSYFKTYSKKNCEMECESRLTEAACGCVQYFMPRTTEETNICNRKDIDCYKEIKRAIDLSNNNTYQCTCLPGCHEISYAKEISVVNLGNGNFEMKEEILSTMDTEYMKKNVALVHIYVQESGFRSFTKGELIGFTEFLSNTGGLLGLFLGFSVLSLIEIVYFMSLRPYFVQKRLNTKLNNQNNIEYDNGNTLTKVFKEKFIMIGSKFKNFGGNRIDHINIEKQRIPSSRFPYYN